MTGTAHELRTEMDLFAEDIVRGISRQPFREVPNLRIEDGVLRPVGRRVEYLRDGKYRGFTDVKTGETYIESTLGDYQKVHALVHEYLHKHVFENEPQNDSEDYVKRKTDEAMEKLNDYLVENGVSYAQLLRLVDETQTFENGDAYFYGRGEKEGGSGGYGDVYSALFALPRYAETAVRKNVNAAIASYLPFLPQVDSSPNVSSWIQAELKSAADKRKENAGKEDKPPKKD